MTLIIAHRGASAEEIENSLAAFRRAREVGADGVELDVHVTADGVPVVHHDPSIGGVEISRARIDEVRKRHLPGGESIPMLAEALEVLMDLAVFVEVKALRDTADDALFDVLDNGPVPSNYQIHAFDHRIVRRLRAERDDFGYGVLQCSYPLSPVRALEESGATVLWQHESLIDANLVEVAHGRGFDVYAWTVDSEARMRELVAVGVDALCTNRPDRAKEWLQ